jgi:NSS family neurotransmitter:Na+ symporter
MLIFSTTTGLLALDVVDQWANNIGIVASAILTTVLVLWIARKGPELRYHLDALSTFRVGRVWIFLVSVLAPVVLGYMLVSRIVVLVTEGYGGLPPWYLLVFGWGTVLVLVVGAVVLSVLRWKPSPDDFTAWPDYPPAGFASTPTAAAVGAEAPGATGARS